MDVVCKHNIATFIQMITSRPEDVGDPVFGRLSKQTSRAEYLHLIYFKLLKSAQLAKVQEHYSHTRVHLSSVEEGFSLASVTLICQSSAQGSG